MKINKQALSERIKKLSAKTGISGNVIIKYYFFDAFIRRLSVSKYHNDMIFKGGFLLSQVIGIAGRTTNDLDFSLHGRPMSLDFISEFTEDIISLHVDDSINFQTVSIAPVRKADEYGGFRIKLIGHLDNIREPISIDVATGDPITPHAVEYEYKSLLTNETIPILSYNIETIISEKLHAVFERKLNNGRAKDFYDLYVLPKMWSSAIDAETLRKAFANTCRQREMKITKEDAFELLEQIKQSREMNNGWINFTKTKSYARGITFPETIEQIEQLLNIIY